MKYIEVSLDQFLNTKQVVEKDCKVVAESKKELVVDCRLGGEGFIILDKEKAKKGFTQFNMMPEEISISDYTQDEYFRESWGYFRLRVYTNSTSKKILANKMTRVLNKHIDKRRKEFGVYFGQGKVEIKL